MMDLYLYEDRPYMKKSNFKERKKKRMPSLSNIESSVSVTNCDIGLMTVAATFDPGKTFLSTADCGHATSGSSSINEGGTCTNTRCDNKEGV